ncbi:sulfatase-like hydrolase/transferase [Aurantibacter crassamenti]|uniref:sulfatase family protein n=1 Tax=Aurantibacter crassamenti TaxID=1837375 RepID=UPI001939E5DC|nr:sulfatase-like hydrolase/transferase [Aurantibacter crassamenti]MBM1104519.1 sulfatase-like hydrolase/transferase [Aurantibacter crassamenti]
MSVKIMVSLFLIAFIGMSSCKESKDLITPKRPNIILIMTDDQGWFDVGFNGNTEIRTPYLDSLAANGIIFDRFYAASAVCSPTRASLITGRNPLRMNIPYANNGHMLAEEITIPELLKKEGYRTAHFGKWHLGTLTKTELDANRGGRPNYVNDYTIPTEHGYDEFFCTESKVPTYDPMVYPKKFKTGESKHFGWQAIQNNDSTENYGTAYWLQENVKETQNLKGDNSKIIVDRVIPFINTSVKEEKPFFSTIWFHTPHLPVVSDSLHRSYYKDLDLAKQIYNGTITAMDKQIGRLWKELEDRGIEEETILFFCSDNGPERATPGSAGIFRDRKRSLYEGGIRVPAFAIWKDKFKGGQRIDYPAVTSDYLPTILDILDLEYPSDRPIDGTSLLAPLTGGSQERMKPIGFICKPQISWVTNQYKLIGDEELENFELYDLLHDKSEENNSIRDFPEIAATMKVDLLDWLNSVENSQKKNDY